MLLYYIRYLAKKALNNAAKWEAYAETVSYDLLMT
jgi:hypothetical protein